MMGMEHSVFGFTLRSSFSLPGVSEGAGERLPELELALGSAEAVRAAWSGPVSNAAWRGTLADGSELSIRWGSTGDLLFGYGEQARFLLAADRARLLCAPEDALALAWQRVLLSRVLPVVALARGYEALHAGAVETPAGVVAVAGPSGVGKSTLVAELLRRGHRLFTDDVLVVGSSSSGAVLAYPGTPHLSLDAGVALESEGEALGVLGGKLWMAVDGAAGESRPLAAVAILDRDGIARPAAEPIAASPLPLAPFMLGLPDEETRRGDRFSIYADLAESARLLRLSGRPRDSPADLADALDLALDLRSASAIGGAG
jgi:hypothetical protein